MFGWLSRRRPESAPLTGAPPVRRQKTYSADSGYVYQYYYLGYRVTEAEGATATEYVFDVSADRKTSFPVSVLVPDDATGRWERARSRDLSATERYAIAKMALFQAFDQREGPAGLRQRVWVDLEALTETLAALGID